MNQKKPLLGCTAAVCTLGCKVNAYESEKMEQSLRAAGCRMVSFEEPADFYLINTCSVTLTAQKKSRQMIHRARQRNPHAKVIACGCYATAPLPEGLCDLCLSNEQKFQVADILEKMFVPETGDVLAQEQITESCQEPVRRDRTRCFLKIQDGCRQFCTYCYIPYVRGPLRSRPDDELEKEAIELVKEGCREIVLTGIHLSSFGLDRRGLVYNTQQGQAYARQCLLELIQKIDAAGIDRIRLGSLEPRLITPEFARQLHAVGTVCPHFHLALQSGCAKTLKAMNRQYTKEEFEQAAETLCQTFPGCALTTDIIVGFPGETQEDHQESKQFVAHIGFAEGHVFRYSPMPGTAAAAMPCQVSAGEKKKRSDDMLKVCGDSSRRFLEKMQGHTYAVLLEQVDRKTGLWTGTCPNYMKAALPMPEGNWQGHIVTAVIRGYAPVRSTNHDASGLDHILKGEPI